MRAIRLILLALLAGSTLSAQEPEELEEADPGIPWRTSYFPYLTGGINDSPVLAARVRHWQPAEYESRVTATAALNLDAGVTSRGSRYFRVEFEAPELWEGWRLRTFGWLERSARYGYFGLGNDSEKNDDLVDETDPFLYRVRRARYKVQAELTRQLSGPLHLAFQGDAEQVRFTSLPGPSVFGGEFPSGELEQGDVSGRLAVVYDTRDNEYNTRQGLLLEAGAQLGSGGDGYTRLYSILRGYLSPLEGTVVALRLAGGGTGGTPPLNARFTLPGWERAVHVLGGQHSHRSFDFGRFAGRGTLIGNLEVRHDVLAFGDLGAITLMAFVDAGRVFEEESFRLTTEDMHVGGGGGIGLRILRSTIFTLNFAGGPEGFNFSVGNGWMF